MGDSVPGMTAPVRPIKELLPHLVWEAVLLLAVAGITIGLLNTNSEVFSRGAPWASFAVLGFAATGLALSLRTATPNLAIGQIATLSAWIYVNQSSVALAILAAAGVGLVLALLVGLTALPAWAVTLTAGFAVQAVLIADSDGRTAPLRLEAGAGRPSFGLWAVAFVVLSLLGAALFAIPRVRTLLSAARPAGGEAGAFGGAKLLGAAVGLLGSAVLAGAAGILQARYVQSASPADSGLLPYALAAVLLGGVSVFGRRAGLAGVVLGVAAVDFTRRWALLERAETATVLLIVAAYGLVGLLVGWLIELIGRRVSPLAGPAPALGGPPGFPAAGLPAGAPAGYEAPGSWPPAAGPLGPGAPPVSGPPLPGAPGYGPPAGAPAGAPGYGPPVSGPPGYGPPPGAPVSGAPGYGPPPGQPQSPPPSWPPVP